MQESQIRARLGTTAHFCEVVVLDNAGRDGAGGGIAIQCRLGKDRTGVYQSVWSHLCLFISRVTSGLVPGVLITSF